jgi:hypothetical protein
MTNAPMPPTSTTTRSSPTTQSGSGDQAKAEARNVAESGKRGASEVADEARTQAAELAHTARQQARHRVDGEVGKLATFLDDIGSELDEMAHGSVRSDGHFPSLARDGAQMANRLSRRLETGGLDGALQDVSRFARRRPGVFLAASFGVGLALGRVTRNADLHEITDEIKHDDGSQPSARTRPQSGASASEHRAATVSHSATTSTPSARSATSASSTVGRTT